MTEHDVLMEELEIKAHRLSDSLDQHELPAVPFLNIEAGYDLTATAVDERYVKEAG